MISTPGQGVLRRRQRRALPAWFACGRPAASRQSRSTLSGTRLSRWPALAGAGVSLSVWPSVYWPELSCWTWRFSLPRAPTLMRSALSYGYRSPMGRRVELGVAQSRIPAVPKLTDPANLRERAPYSVPSQRPMGKRGTPPFVPLLCDLWGLGTGFRGPAEGPTPPRSLGSPQPDDHLTRFVSRPI